MSMLLVIVSYAVTLAVGVVLGYGHGRAVVIEQIFKIAKRTEGTNNA